VNRARDVIRILAPLCALVVSATGSGFAAGYDYKAVAYLDTTAPGGGKLVNDFEAGAISDKGEVAFIVDYNESDSEALYLATDQGLIPIVEPGKPATDGWTFVASGPIGMIIGPVSMNASGDIAFGSDIQKGGTTSSANFVWHRSTQSLTAVNLPGDPAPGGGTFGDVPGQAWTSLNDRGDVLFEALVPNASGDQELGMFLRTADGKISAIVRPGDKSPEGGTFSLPKRSRGTLNVSGQIAFRANVEMGSTWTGVYLYQDGKITPIATPAITAPSGAKFVEARDPHINNKGQIAFLGDTGSGFGVYLYDNGQIKALGTPAMDLPGGGKLEGAGSSECALALNQAGAVAVVLVSDNGAGVYSFHDGKVEVVARDGMNLPGLGTPDTVPGDKCAAISNLGHVAFQAELPGDKVALVLATPIP
jgi:hypothetical protein